MSQLRRALVLAAFAAGIIPGGPPMPRCDIHGIPNSKARNTGAAKQKRAAKKRRNR